MINIAIDGPTGAGKSTVAKAISEKMGILYLDTGAMYRAIGLKALSYGVSPSDADAVKGFLKDTEVDIKYENGEQIILLDSECVNEKIRKHEVSKAASDASAIPEVRIKLVESQREIAHKNDCILDGRDIGTYVLPDADIKIFLTASPEIRAERRYKELVGRGQAVTYEKVLADLLERDKNDSERAFAPLRKAADAILVDSGNMTFEEVVVFVENLIISSTAYNKPEAVSKRQQKKEKKTSKLLTKRKPPRAARLFRFAQILFYLPMSLLFPIKVIGKRKFDKRRTVLIMNHKSAWDPVLIAHLFRPACYFMVKVQLSKVPFLSGILRSLGCIFTNRGSPDKFATNMAVDVLENEKILALFPEGTRNKKAGGELGAFKTGTAYFAIKGRAHIRPIIIHKKIRPFRFNTVITGDEFSLEEYYDKPLTRDVLEEATEKIREKCIALQEKLKQHIESKGKKW